MRLRYYANGARFQPGDRLSRSDILCMRMLRARDEWDVLAILITGRPLPPAGGMGPKPGTEKILERWRGAFPEAAKLMDRVRKGQC